MQPLHDADIVGIVGPNQAMADQEIDDDKVAVELELLRVPNDGGHFLDRHQREALDLAVASGGVHMLGTSGTVTTLAGVHLGLPRYDRRRVDGTWLSGDQVGTLVGTLLSMDYDARVGNPRSPRDRPALQHVPVADAVFVGS